MKPFTAFLVRHGIKPNTITSLSLILMVPASYLLIIHKENMFIIVFSVVAFLDALDGAVAENENMKTKFGAFYDSFVDRTVEGMLYLAVAVSYPYLCIFSFITLILSYLVSYTAAWEKNLKNIGTGKRAIRISIFIIFFILHEILYGLLIISFISSVTVLHRIYEMVKNYKEL